MYAGKNQRWHDAAFRILKGYGLPTDVAKELEKRLAAELAAAYEKGKMDEFWRGGEVAIP